MDPQTHCTYRVHPLSPELLQTHTTQGGVSKQVALVGLYAASEKLCRLLVVGFVGVLRSMWLVFFGKDAPLGWLIFFLEKMSPLVGWWFFFKRCLPRLVGGFSVKDPPLVGW